MTGEIKVDKNATFTDVVKPKVVFKINYRVESTTTDVVRNTAQNRVAEVDRHKNFRATSATLAQKLQKVTICLNIS